MKYFYTLMLGGLAALITKVTFTSPMPVPYDDKWDAYLSSWIGHYLLFIIIASSLAIHIYKTHIKG